MLAFRTRISASPELLLHPFRKMAASKSATAWRVEMDTEYVLPEWKKSRGLSADCRLAVLPRDLGQSHEGTYSKIYKYLPAASRSQNELNSLSMRVPRSACVQWGAKHSSIGAKSACGGGQSHTPKLRMIGLIAMTAVTAVASRMDPVQ